MSDAAQPTAAEVRAAAEAVKTALDRHLAAVERRSGQDDPAVYEAFNALAAAAEAYDELLYDRHDEVTPFEIPDVDDSPPPYAGPEEPHALSVLIRRDYAVVEPQRLIAQARRVTDLDREDEPVTTHAALGVLFGEYEPDEIASRHTEFGLEEGDSTLWIEAAEDLAEPGEWLNDPFDHIDQESIVCRFDVSAVFDDEDDDHDDEDADDEDDIEDVEGDGHDEDEEDHDEDDEHDDVNDGESDGQVPVRRA
ncbi:hypothetical protein AB0C52_23095 [Streptomyces sp. NPDC048717]|uniref:hypothetical protein n=1 Tax=Streptomyces sp. NPDC048717 TaxID=3154928 RepID=UPI00342CC2FB